MMAMKSVFLHVYCYILFLLVVELIGMMDSLAIGSEIIQTETSKHDYIRACYYTNWSQYRFGVNETDERARFFPDEHYVPGLCTHVLFAFASIDETFIPKALDESDLPSLEGAGMYARVNALKKLDSNLKTILSFGGANAKNVFENLTSSMDGRSTFVNSTIKFVRRHGFDGIDIDWEFPKSSNRDNFTQLLHEFRQRMTMEAEATGNDELLLTAAVSASKWTINEAYDVQEISELVDFILLMSYNYHGFWGNDINFTGHNSPLFPRQNESIFHQTYLNTNFSANYWHSQGMPKRKIVIGVANYGRGWTLLDSSNDYGLGAGTALLPSNACTYTKTAGIASYFEICEMLAAGASRYWSEEHQVPYLVHDDQWFGYDDKESIRNKMNWIKNNGFGGAFVWTLSFDDFNGKCTNGDGKKFPLTSTIHDCLSNAC